MPRGKGGIGKSRRELLRLERERTALTEEQVWLSEERTILSKERTILAFLQTGLAFIAVGLTVVNLAAAHLLQDPYTPWVGWALIAIGFVEILDSVRRLRRYKKKMERVKIKLGKEEI